jgi:trans-2,3-dihydro-3-hydroxyanthranilate isomerase
MLRLAYRVIDVFTRERFGGNPLAVFPDAQGLPPERMQRIAFELNLSETTFVLPTEAPGCDARVRIFTPRAELPLAGHPTVGTAFVVGELLPAEQGAAGSKRLVLELGVGPTPVERIAGPDGGPIWRMSQPPPRVGPTAADPAAVARALGLDAEALEPSLPPTVVTVGPRALLVALRGIDALARARVRPEPWEAVAGPLGDPGAYAFVSTGPSTVQARFFAPSHGIAEDPATGSAAGPLGAWLFAHGRLAPGADGVARLEVAQGLEMGRPSRLFVEIEGDGDAVRAVRVGGACVPVASGWLET